MQVKTPVPRTPQAHKNSEALRKATFAELQPICSRLFSYGTDPVGIGNQLVLLEQVISDSEVEGLQDCLDYLLFPLQLSMDAIYVFRQSEEDVNASQSSERSSFAQLSAFSSLKVAETALQVVLSLMKVCSCSRVPQLLALLQRVSSLLTLPHAETSEELRLMTLQVVSAIFHCEHKGGAIHELSDSEDASAQLGHLLSLLVKYPEQERTHGQQASKKVQHEAMRALRSMIQVMDNVESLSFFLPGLVIGLSRELLMASKVKASQGSVLETLETLRILFVNTLADHTLFNVLKGDSRKESQVVKEGRGTRVTTGMTSDLALRELEALKNRVKGASLKECNSPPVSKYPSPSIKTNESTQRDETRRSESNPRLRVDGTPDWLKETGKHVEQTLEVVLPQLLNDGRPAVRASLVTFCSSLLSKCCLSLPGCRHLLLDCILSLAQDDWPQVKDAAKSWLKQILKSNSKLCSVIQSLIEIAFLDWVQTLAASLRTSQTAGQLQALKLTTCLECLSPALIADLVFKNAAFTNIVVGSFVNSFAIDHESAALLLMMPPETVDLYALESGEEVSRESSIPLPRIPLYLKIITTQKCYRAVSGLLHALASVAVDASQQCTGTPYSFVHSLLDACLQSLQGLLERAEFPGQKTRLLKKGSKKSRRSIAPRVPLSIESEDGLLMPWTAQAAQIIAVVSEIMYGMRLNHLSKGKDELLESMDSLLHALLLVIIDERIWALQTSKSKEPFSKSRIQSGFMNENMVLGCNILLLRTVMDCIGVTAICMGGQFCNNGRFTRISLLPVVEKLDDPSAIVSSAALLALHCMAIGCVSRDGNSLRQLFYLNSDYVVDGLCRQLRQPELYPRAPNLFSAILKQNGIASGLLPLLAEPARHALLGTSILFRHRSPQHVLNFVYCLREIAKGAEVLASEVLDALHALRKEMQQHGRTKHTSSKIVDGSGTSDPLNVDGSEVDIGKIKSFFELHNGKQKDSGVDNSNSINNGHDAVVHNSGRVVDELLPLGVKIRVSMEEWNNYQVLKQQAGSCAGLGQSISDSIGPLAASTNLDVAVQALKASTQALQALSKAHYALELCKNDIETCMDPPPAALAAVPGDKESSSKTLLPSVHLLWGPLMGALGDWRIAVVENALISMEKLAHLSGQFLARRFYQDAWVVMVRLLSEGPSQQRLLAPGQDDLFSPMIVQRARLAVIQCLQNLALPENTNGIAVILPMVKDAIVAVSNFMDDGQAAPVREEATKCFMRLASLDSDVAWSLLAEAIRKDVPRTQSGLNSQVYAGKLGWNSLNLKESGLGRCSILKLEALLSKVDELPVLWHVEVQKQLDAFSESD